MLSDSMTFLDDEDLLRIFGGPMPVPVKEWKGFGKVSVRMAEMHLKDRRVEGLLVGVSGKELDHFYRRLLDIPAEQKLQPYQLADCVALVHYVQDVSWASSKDFMQIAARAKGECHFVAITDNVVNLNVPQDSVFIGGIFGHEGNFGCVLPQPNDIIVAVMDGEGFINSLSNFEDLACRAKVRLDNDQYKLAHVKDEVLSASYALHLPHLHAFDSFWFVDGAAVDSVPCDSDKTTWQPAIVWEE